MAASEEDDTAPSTPPNTSDIPPDVPQSTRRESSRLRTPMRRPGFIATETDSRRALVGNRNVPKPGRKQTATTEDADEDGGNEDEVEEIALSGVIQVSKRTGRAVEVDLVQDSDEENQKAATAKAPRDKTKDRDGFDHAVLYFYPPGEGPKQAPGELAHACRWCPKEYMATDRSTSNLKTHRDGAIFKTSQRLPCPGRAKAIAAGASLPPTAAAVYVESAHRHMDDTAVTPLVANRRLPPPSYVRLCTPHLKPPVSYLGGFASTSTVSSTASTGDQVDPAVAAKFRAFDSTQWDVVNNHHRCTCHVIALILGAGLRALSLSTKMVRPERSDQTFPTLETVTEEDEEEEDESEEIVEVIDHESHEEVVDPDDAETPLPEPGWEQEDDNSDVDESDLSGIGFTLKKIFACNLYYLDRLYFSTNCFKSQKQAEWKLWAKKLGFQGRGLIGGYGIRWNIAYNSRQRAYEGRRVIKQLLENESDKYAGKSAADHFFKSYELTSKEWEDINNLNQVLKEFLELTKRFEGDGPKLLWFYSNPQEVSQLGVALRHSGDGDLSSPILAHDAIHQSFP
ncbi:hypothetical protein KEM48_011132 [Puccinia striiformis f. sp. tritici PST-130]|nr:hypothetical protein KEM48_011132 [Puccinia striiformis f. sp. tritici PST-130]